MMVDNGRAVGPNNRPLTEVILRNAARCDNPECGEYIESVHRHDFRSCKCGSVSVDGGRDYVRRLFGNEHGFTDLSLSRHVEMSDAEIQRHHEYGFW